MKNIIDEISQKTRILKFDVQHFIETAPNRYKVYTIPKRNGDERLIAHPARELKAIQRVLVEIMRPKLNIHPMAQAYERKTSIVTNARIHSGSNWIAKFDLNNFFNSITERYWKDYLGTLKIGSELSDISSRVFFWNASKVEPNCLSVGAPSSPFASNRFMYSFDHTVNNYCKDNNLKYTRYADDIIISSMNKIFLEPLEMAINSSFAFQNQFQINAQKTKLLGPGQRKTVTGVILTNDGSISVGRNRKRKIEAMIHGLANGKYVNRKNEIIGNFAFLKMVDPIAHAKILEKHKDIKAIFNNKKDGSFEPPN